MWDAKKTSQCELKPKNRHTTLQTLENTLNKIFLQNSGVRVISNYAYTEEVTGLVAEG